MAHFAELDKNNVVVRVIVIDNNALIDEDGDEAEYLGIMECQRLCGPSRWIQTSYNNSFRGHYARRGDIYDPRLDIFVSAKPEEFPSFILDEKLGDWIPPVPMPNDGNRYIWDEYDQEWLLEDAFSMPRSYEE